MSTNRVEVVRDCVMAALRRKSHRTYCELLQECFERVPGPDEKCRLLFDDVLRQLENAGVILWLAGDVKLVEGAVHRTSQGGGLTGSQIFALKGK